MAAAAPRRIEIVPWGFWKSTSGFTPTRGQNSGRLGGGAMYQGTPANGDWIEWEVLLDAGTWALDLIWARDPSLGIVDFTLGATAVGTQDMYGGAASNAVTTFSGIAVASAGTYALRATINGKNASSSNYYMVIQLLTLRRTGA
jgi:hypothetical protein